MKKPDWKPGEDLKEVIRLAVTDFRKELCLDAYTIDTRYQSCDKEDDESHEVGTAMDITPDHRYLRAVMCIYPKTEAVFEREGEVGVREIVAHEIAHIATNKLASLAHERYANEREIEEADEALTETLGRYAFRAVEANRK